MGSRLEGVDVLLEGCGPSTGVLARQLVVTTI